MVTCDTSEYEEGLDKAGQKTSLFGDLVKANLTSDAIKAGVKKLASAVVEVGKASLEAYGDYEQLAGGAQLMFGEAYNTVAQNAKNAYKTVQMSQNDYLQQVNGFATGLKTALGGNEQAAADLAHKIVVAEADVVAATGNTQEAVQNAFNGIMKTNYTMLDNLQLGITPTKEGFQELIDKVNEWNAAQGNATNYTIDNLADAQSALVDYIEMQGLAGYAGMEAADTIQGSTASMKAAWENLSTGMADETADMEQLTQDFVDSVGAAAKNVLPRIQQIATGVGTATVETISYLRETNETIDLVVSVVEDLGIVAAATGTVLGANLAGKTVANIATVFKANAEALAFFTVESGKAAVAEAALNGTFSVAETAVGVLTGKISLATAAQYAWNTAMNANPIGIVIAAVAALGIAAKNAYSTMKANAKDLAGESQTLSEATAKLEELNAQYDNIANHPELYGNTLAWSNALNEQRMAIKEVETQIEGLTDAETAAAITSGELSAKTLEDAETLETATQNYAEAAQVILDDYLNTYQSIYDSIHSMGSAFTKVAEATDITWEQAMTNIKANTALLEGMDANFEYISRAASDARIDISGFNEMLAAMSTEDAAALLAGLKGELEESGATSAESARKLYELHDAVDAYKNSGTDYSQSLAAKVEDIQKRILEVTDEYKEAVKGLDQEAEAIEAGETTLEGLVAGITNSTPEVLSSIDSLASQMKARLKTQFDDFVLNINAKISAASADGSHESGLDYVPFDGYIAELHKGERVLTAEEASAYRAGKDSADGGSGGVVINQYIQTSVETPAELAAATEAYFQQARWAVAL